VLNNALLGAVDPRGIANPESDPARWGTWVENACLAHAWNRGQRVTYWREEPIEVDGVLEGSWGRWAIEVKTGAFDRRSLQGLLEFTSRNPGFRALVLCDRAHRTTVEALRVPWQDWREFLLDGPPR
jgi:hypothetical protein